MNTTSLTERYVDAAMRTVPDRQRADLGAELRASIADQIDARVDDGEPHDIAERAVLTDSATPTSWRRATPSGPCGSSDRATTSRGGD